MVAETGEATARFLRSIAEGEVDCREAISEQAARGLQRMRSVKLDEQGGRPGKESCRIASHELVRTTSCLSWACLGRPAIKIGGIVFSVRNSFPCRGRALLKASLLAKRLSSEHQQRNCICWVCPLLVL